MRAIAILAIIIKNIRFKNKKKFDLKENVCTKKAVESVQIQGSVVKNLLYLII
jgi:hypothetical protein